MKDKEWLEKVKITGIKSVPKNSDLCVIVLTYNSVERIEKFLKIMQGQTYKPDILVVDNSSGRKVVDAIKNHGISILHVDGLNVGTAGAFFIGQAFAMRMGYEWMINSDDDAYPASKDYVEKLLAGTKSQNALIGYGYQKLYGQLIKDTCIGWVPQLGLVNRKVFEKVGCFDPRMCKMIEESEFLTRLKIFKINSACVKNAAYDHPISAWSAGWSGKFMYYSFRNFLFLKQLHLRNIVGLFAYTSTAFYASYEDPRMIGCFLAAISDFLRGEYYYSDRLFDETIKYPVQLERTKLSNMKGKLNYVALLSENPLFLRQNAEHLERSELIRALNKDVLFGSGNFFNQLFLLFGKTYLYEPETGYLYLVRKRKNIVFDYLAFFLLTVLSFLVFVPLCIYLVASHYLSVRSMAADVDWQRRLADSLLDSFPASDAGKTG